MANTATSRAFSILLALYTHSRSVDADIEPTSQDDNVTCGKRTIITHSEGQGNLTPVLEKSEAALLLLLGFGGFSVLLAFLYNAIRQYVFHDKNNLNTTFDAGGRVSVSLTAVTVASQLLWPGDLLQVATVTIKYGIAGSFWYSSAAVINMILFPMLSVKFKIRAPGAKTFLQVIYARFGPRTHVVFCCFAVALNILIVIMLVAASAPLFKALIKDASDEFCVLILATLFGSYSFIGGLGSTFYVSYFNAAVIFVLLATFILKVFFEESSVQGGFSGMYERIRCLQGPERNEESSYLTFWSEGAVIWAVQGFFATAAITFCDQASWQSRIAAKPIQGVLGFYVATYMWFAIPSTIGTSIGLAYLDQSALNATSALPETDLDAGLATAFMAQHKLGVAGSYMVLSMIIMSLMSTGSGEVMAVSSIVVYDVYQTYIKPFRRVPGTSYCVLCGRIKPNEVDHESPVLDACKCPPTAQCQHCSHDLRPLDKNSMRAGQRIYSCPIHGEFRMYQDYLIQFKSWVVLWVTVGIVPLGLVVIASGVDLNWLIVCGFIIIMPSFPGAFLTVCWVRTTSAAMLTGSISGLVGGITANLIVASTFEGGVSLKNMAQNYAVLAGSCTAFGLSLILTIVVSLLTNKIHSSHEEKLEWQQVRDIDNPLYSWVDTYQDDFPQLKGGVKPSCEELEQVFRHARWVAYIGGGFSIFLFILFIPGIMSALHVLTEQQFHSWVTVLQVWCFFMAAVVIIVVPIEEIVIIVSHIRKNRKCGSKPSPSKASGVTSQEEMTQLVTTEGRSNVKENGLGADRVSFAP